VDFATEAPTWADFVAAFELYRDPLVCGFVGGAVLGYLSVYVVLRRMVFVSAAVTQAAGLGIALSFYEEIHHHTHIDPLHAAAALALLATLLILLEPRGGRITREGLLGFAYAAASGAAVLVGAKISQEAHDVQAILFGTAVLVRPEDVSAVKLVGAIVLVLHVWWYRGLTFAVFDPIAARVQRLPVQLLQALVLISIGAVVGVTARAL
jgi:zinc transport system permease protein